MEEQSGGEERVRRRSGGSKCFEISSPGFYCLTAGLLLLLLLWCADIDLIEDMGRL